MTASEDFVQKQSQRNPLFFIGCSPSQAETIINPEYPANGVMISVNSLRSRRSTLKVDRWILDSGAFTEISRWGHYRYSIEEYVHQINKWSKCGHLLCAVSQDWMCEPFILEKTGLTVSDHQRLTIERFVELKSYNLNVPLMPVLQGYQVSDYLVHLQMYGKLLNEGQWVGVGSVCRRNGQPQEIRDIFKSIKTMRPDLRLHGFGLKQLALENKETREFIYSCDSMAWSMPKRFKDPTPTVKLAHDYQETIYKAVTDTVQKRVPVTAGAGNGQGRKPNWKSGKTKAIRIPEKFADRLLSLAKEWDLES